MIYKSYIVEENIKSLKNNIVLIYGENLGLINDLKKKIGNEALKNQIIKVNQEDLLKNPGYLFSQIKNISLFEDQKFIFIENATDKILEPIVEIEPDVENNKIYLFGNTLEKRSKLRLHFESSSKFDVVPCYEDSEITIKKIISNNLKGFSGVSTQLINLLVEKVGFNRVKLNNEIEKIKIFFNDKSITIDDLDKLLNDKEENDFNHIKDSALKGDNILTNKLLSSTIFEKEKIPLYLSIISQRLFKLKELALLTLNSNENEAIKNIKPPIFWKDKPNFLQQIRLWKTDKLNVALNKIYKYEMMFKSNGNLDKEILIKKLLVDICSLAKI